MEAIGGASENEHQEGRQVTLEYKLMQGGTRRAVGDAIGFGEGQGKGEDLLSPLIEQTATEVLGAVRNLTAAE